LKFESEQDDIGNSQEHHEPRYEAIASPFKDIEKSGKKGSTKNYAKSPAFQHVDKVEGECGLIETMLLLEDEGLIQAKGQGWKGRKKSQQKDKHNRLGDLRESAIKQSSTKQTLEDIPDTLGHIRLIL
jgi:hypothetical protein